MGIALAKVSEEVDKDVVPQTLGMIFRSARTRQNKDLEAISEQLKIRKVFLQAIENEQFDILPGGVYTIGFIRSYAQYLGLDHDAIIDQLKDESFCSPVRLSSVGDEQHFPTTRFVPSTMVFIGLLLLVLCGISAYFFLEDAPIHINWPSMTKTSL
jgi:cytoskeleton protein RodZ